MSKSAFVWSPRYEVDIGKHVFPTVKFRLIKERIVELGIAREEEIEEPQPATDEELLTVLDPEYLADMRTYKHTERTLRSELPISRAIVEGSAVTAGGTILCARRALERGAAFHCGGGYHHGFAGHAEGFCYINDIAVAAGVMLKEGAVKRISIVDTDLHQGNGTARIFQDVPDVFTFSIHEEENYPRPKQRSDLDIGMISFPGDELYMRELKEGLKAAIEGHKPDLVFIAAGADPFENDQLGRMGLSWSAMRERDRLCVEACASRGIPFVTVTAGGYSRILQETVDLHVQTIESGVEALKR